MALAALTLHKRTPGWGFQDPGSYTFGGHTFRNDVRSGQGWVDMNRAIVVSNDTYFYMLAHDLGVNAIAGFMKPWGFGQITGIDISGEARGILPSTDWKRKAYRKPEQQRWYEGETISLGIGQGYNSFTILQLAHATATLANNGVVMKPHLVRDIENPITKDTRAVVRDPSDKIAVKQSDIDIIKRAMEGVVTNGTASKLFIGAQYQAAGKTGHGAGLLAARRELQGPRDRRASARPRALHRVRAGRATEDRARADRRKRRLGCGVGRSDRAQGARLLPRRQEQARRASGGRRGGGVGNRRRVRASGRRRAGDAGSGATGQGRGGLHRVADSRRGFGGGGSFGCGSFGGCGCECRLRASSSFHRGGNGCVGGSARLRVRRRKENSVA